MTEFFTIVDRANLALIQQETEFQNEKTVVLLTGNQQSINKPVNDGSSTQRKQVKTAPVKDTTVQICSDLIVNGFNGIIGE